jgi:hypothetical protein
MLARAIMGGGGAQAIIGADMHAKVHTTTTANRQRSALVLN